MDPSTHGLKWIGGFENALESGSSVVCDVLRDLRDIVGDRSSVICHFINELEAYLALWLRSSHGRVEYVRARQRNVRYVERIVYGRQ